MGLYIFSKGISNNIKNNNNDERFSNHINIQFLKDIIDDSYSGSDWIDNSFTIFKSINDIIYLVYPNKESLIFYDLINNQKISEIKNANKGSITSIKYYLDKNNKKDLIMSICRKKRDIKLWNANNNECFLNIKDIVEASFLSENNQIYIVTNKLEVLDLKGKQVNKINDSNSTINIIDIYYDNELSKTFIITGNYGNCKSYDYKENKIYHTYSDNNNKEDDHCSIIINNKGKDKKELIESSWDGNIRIWNFHSGELLNKIKVSDKALMAICLWNNDYLFVGDENNLINIIDLKSKEVIKSLSGHNNNIITLKKIIHPKFGECLISKGGYGDKIKLWNIKK